MQEQEYDLINKLIDTYVILELIINSPDAKQEAEYQLELIKTKLQAMGITETSRLDRKETA